MKGENIMQIFFFILLGVIITILSVIAFAELGLILLGGIAFGLILYITVRVSKMPSSKRKVQWVYYLAQFSKKNASIF